MTLSLKKELNPIGESNRAKKIKENLAKYATEALWSDLGDYVDEEDVEFLLTEIDRLTEQLKQADTAWQANESRIVGICKLLGIDYTLEEPSIEVEVKRLIAALEEKEKECEYWHSRYDAAMYMKRICKV